MIRTAKWTMGLTFAALMITACGQLPGAGGARIAVINLDEVAKATGQDKVLQQQMKAARTELNAGLDELAGKLEQQLADEQARLGESEPGQIQQLTAQAQQQYAQAQALAQQRAQQYQARLVTDFQDTVRPVAAEVAASLGAKAVLINGPILYWNDPLVSITDGVIAEISKRSITFSEPSGIQGMLELQPAAETPAEQTE